METVSFVRAPDYDAPDFFARMDRLVAPVFDAASARPGMTVLLKPNLLGSAAPERAAATHPRVVEYFVRRFVAAGLRVRVGDSPAVEPLRRVAAAAGMLPVVEPLGAEWAEFKAEREYADDGPFAFNRLLLAEAVGEADLVVNLAKVKTHGQMTLTLAVKNTFGCIVGLKKAGWHLKAGKDYVSFAEMLLAVSRLVAPVLHVLDGVVAMEGNGPFGGTPRRTGFLAASANPHALDRFVAGLLGVDPAAVPTLAVAEAKGLPGARAGAYRIVGDDPGALVIRDFRPARQAPLGWSLPGPVRRALEHRLTPFPEVVAAGCVGCGACVTICPARTIALDGRRVARIGRSACIHCFCCQEVCPEATIVVRTPLLARILGRLRRPPRVDAPRRK